MQIMSVNLVLFDNTSQPSWGLGDTYFTDFNRRALTEFADQLPSERGGQAWLFWDSELGQPDENFIGAIARSKIDVWHSGLLLGTSGLPRILDFAKPTWMFNRDPPSNIEASSWRLSLRACMIRSEVIQELGFVHPNFHSLDAAGLELGYRYLQSGVIMRHTPSLLKREILQNPPDIPLDDELLFLHLTQEKNTKYWAIGRSIMTQYVMPLKAINAVRKFNYIERPKYKPYSVNQELLETWKYSPSEANVTVLIPTLDRYPYLRKLLGQLREQTIKPLEIVIVDQTNYCFRDMAIANDFRDLPLILIYQDIAGQCSSRNAGLGVAKGNYILFLDDDDEIESDLIEKHLRNILHFDADTSSGSVNEIGALPLTGVYKNTRLSDVFPTNNTLIRKSVLTRSGLFDLAYNQRQSEDGDLGTRVYLSGALMIYNPQILVLHHRALSGGLRKHKARVVTYSSSRQKLFHRRFPHISEVYLGKRYFTTSQLHEAHWMSIAGTFSVRGGVMHKLLKILIALILLPNSVYQIKQRIRGADELLKKYPQIPTIH